MKLFSLAFFGKLFPKSPSTLRLLLVVSAAFVQILVCVQTAHAQANTPLTAFPTFNGDISAIAVDGTTIYVGGGFTQATNSPINGGQTVTRTYLAAIDANTGALLPFNPVLNARVSPMIINVGLGRLYVGGDFTIVNGNTRNLVCSFDLGTNNLNSWNPISSYVGAYVRKFAFDGNTLYAAGDFTQINGTNRKYGCAFDATGVGSLIIPFFPDMADNLTLTVAYDGTRVHFGGNFTGINGDIGRTRFGAVDKITGANAAWGTGYGDGAVHTTLVDGSFIYVGGSFTTPHPRNRMNRQDLTTAAIDAWDPNIGNNSVWSIARNNSANLTFVGGGFTIVNGGTTRNGLAAFDNAGTATAFNPDITSGSVDALVYDAAKNQLYTGGTFTHVGGSMRRGFAVFTNEPGPTISGFAPGAGYPMSTVTINGTNLLSPGLVLFNGVPATGVKVINATQIQVVVPYGATTGPITVSNGPGSVVSGGSFTVTVAPQVTTLAGTAASGFGDFSGTLAQFNSVMGVVRVGTDLFLAEFDNYRVRRFDLTTGLVSTLAGNGIQATIDGTGTSASFNQLTGICSDGAGNLYVTEQGGSARIRKIVIGTGVVTTFAGNGNGFMDGTGAGAQFNTPSQLCFTGGNIYVADRGNHRIRQVTLGGMVTTIAGSGAPGAMDGTGGAAQFNLPEGICSDGLGNLYIAEQGTHRIRKVVISSGVVTTAAGSSIGFNDGAALSAQFSFPGGIVCDATGNLYVADGSNNRIRRISKATGMVTTVAGTGALGTVDGAPNSAQIGSPHGIWYDNATDEIYIGEVISRHALRKISFYRYQYASGDAGLPGSWQIPGPIGALNFTNTASSFTVASGTATATSPFTLGANVEMTVQNAATLSLNNIAMTNNGSLVIESGATGGKLNIIGTGSVTGTPVFYVDNKSTLEYTGNVAKTATTFEIPNPFLGGLVIATSSPGVVTLPAPTTISAAATVSVNSGGRLSIPIGLSVTNNNPGATSFTVQTGGALEIRDNGQINAGSASAVNYISGSMLEYIGPGAKTITAPEFPATLNANLIINNTGGVTLNAAKALSPTSTLTLTAGKIITSPVNMLTVQNTAAGAVTAAVGTFVDGPLRRTFLASLAAPAVTYSFPVGKGATPYPFAILNPTTGGVGPVVEVEAFALNAMGMVGTNISLLSTTEYWLTTQVSGNYTSGIIYLSKAGLMATNTIGGNPAMAIGTYNGYTSTLGTGLTTVAPVTGVGHFIVGTGPSIYDWIGGANGDWTVAVNWTPTRSVPASTDILRFNAGTYAPINIPNQAIQQLIIGGDVTFPPVAIALSVGIGGVQIATMRSLDLGPNITLQQNAGGTITVDGTLNTNVSKVNGAGDFLLNASGTFATSNSNGFNGFDAITGAMQMTGTIMYNPAASYSFTGTSGPTYPTGFAPVMVKPAISQLGNLTVAASTFGRIVDNNVTASGLVTVSGILETFNRILTLSGTGTLLVPSGGRMIASPGGTITNNNVSGTSFTVQNTGTLEIQNNGQVTGSSDVNYAAGSTLEYSGTVAKTTTARETATVQQMLVSNTAPVTLGANATVQQSLTVNNGSKLILSNTGNPTLSINGTLNLNASGLLASVNGANAGSLSLGGTSAVSLRMDPTDNTLQNFTVNRSGTHTVTGDFNVRGTLNLVDGILLPSTRILSGGPLPSDAAGVITGGNPTSYVQGSLQRRFANNIVTNGTNYDFPVGTVSGFRGASMLDVLTGANTPVVQIDVADAGALTRDITLTSLFGTRNWHVQMMSGLFNGSAIALTETGLTASNVVARSVLQGGAYTTAGGNNVGTSVTSGANAVPASVNHFFAVGSVQPTVFSVMPSNVSPGDTLTITGLGLGAVTSVGIGGFVAASFQVISNTEIRAVVGAGGTGAITLISPTGVAMSMQTVTFLNAPIVSSFTPLYGTTGSTVRITGSRFTGATNVSFGSLNALRFTTLDANTIDAVVNLGNSGLISVQTPNGIGLSSSMFDFILKPSIVQFLPNWVKSGDTTNVNFSPNWAKVGDTLNIYGRYFPRASGVNFGNSAYKSIFQIVTNGQIRIIIPPDASTGLIRVQNPVGTDSLGTFTIVRIPSISSVKPPTLVGIGQTLTISGTEFHPFPLVRIGTTTAASVEWTSLNEIRAIFTQATTGFLSVISSGGTVSNPNPIQVIPPPTITSFAPESPLPGELVTVTGANFVANLLLVRVNGMLIQTVQRQTDNRLTFTMPPATTAGPMVVTSIGGSTTTTITFQPLTITRTQPQSQQIGQEVILTGTRFTGVTAVRFGGINVAPTQYTVLSPTQIRVRVPSGVTTGTISVVGAAGTGTFTGFTVLVPTPAITSFAPTMARSGDVVTIIGENFTGTLHVGFGGATTAQFTVVSPTQIRATVPVNASSGSISVVNGSGAASPRLGFVLIPPVVDPNAALSKFPTFNGGIWAIAVNGTTIFVGGAFTKATNSPINGGNAVTRSNLAAIDANTGAILPFNPQFNNSVRCLIVHGGLGRLYVGGDFTMVNSNTRNLVCSFDVATNTLNSWNPISSYLLHSSTVGAYIRSFALDGNSVYTVGQFTQLNGTLRKYGCFFDGTGSGSVDATFFPDMADNQTLGVAVSGGFAFFGGNFTGINGNIAYARFGRVDKTNGTLNGWGGYGVGAVHTFMIDGSFLYTGGTFVAPHSRNRINRQDLALNGAMDAWDPNIGNGSVWAMASSGGNIYAGGDFTLVNGGTTRNALACFDNNGTATNFNPDITGGAVVAVAASGTIVYAGGDFTSVGGQMRRGFAAFTPGATPSGGTTLPSTTVPIVSSFAPESAAPMQSVTITGTRFTGATKVEFGDKEAWFKVVSATEIQTVVPFGAMSGEVRVTKEMETGSRPGFTVLELPKVSTIVGNGTAGLTNAAGQAAELYAPRFGSRVGNSIYFSTVHAIRKFNIQTGEVSTVAGGLVNGKDDGVGTAAQFDQPFGVLPSDESGGEGSTHLLVADYHSRKIRIVDISSGAVRTFAGTGERTIEGGSLSGASFFTPQGIARVPNGNGILITDHEAHIIRGISRFGVSIEAGQPSVVGSIDDVLPENARFNGPGGIVVDDKYNVFIADRGGHSIRKFSLPTGAVTTLAGTGVAGFADGTSGTAQFNNPIGLTLNGTTLFVADLFNHRIRAVSTLTGEVVTVAGSGTQGFADGTTQAAQFNAPNSLLWDHDALLVFDTDNQRIRRVEVGEIVFAAPVTGGTVVVTGAIVQAPMRILNVDPTTVTEDSPLTLRGENISTNASVSLSTGSLASLPLEIVSLSTTAIVVQVPKNIVPSILLVTSARLVVTTPTVRINVFPSIQVNARDLPAISTIFPSVASTRSIISILGQNFAPPDSAVRGSVRSVTIGGVPVGAFTVVSPAVINVTVGTVKSGKVLVQTATLLLESQTLFTLDTTKAPVVVVLPEPVLSKDSLALNRLFTSTQGMNWTTTTNWTNAAPIGLRFGVTIRNGRVVELRLPNSGIKGAIPPEVLENLDSLKVLDLGNNSLSGAIPQGLSNAKNLEVLRLANNTFSGALPKEVKIMTKLREIDLSGNHITDNLSSLAGLTNVTVLNLRGNSFQGRLADAIPKMTALAILDLSGNNISGGLPDELVELTQLQIFNVRRNNLTGSFPLGLVRGRTKTVARTQAAVGLEVLDLGENTFSGTIPEEIGNLQNLTKISLDHNAFTGSLPASMRTMGFLRRIDVSHNQFTGAPDFSDLIRLDTLSVENNQFPVAVLELFVGIRRSLTYLPQAAFTPPSILSRVATATNSTASVVTVIAQDSLRLMVPKTEMYSRTQWRKNGIPLTNIRNANRHADLIIPAFALADSGVYDCVITNDRLPGIILTTAQVQVLGRLPLVAPSAVVLIEPSANAQDVNTTPQFRWTRVGSVDSYRLELASDSSFVTVIASATIPNTAELSIAGTVVVSSESLPTFFGSSFPLATDRVHFWRVRSENTAGASSWVVRRFTTVPPNAQVTISNLNFGKMIRFDTARGTVRLQNLSSSTLTIESIQTALADFQVDSVPLPRTVSAGGEVKLPIRLIAQTVGRLSSAMTVSFRVGMSAVVQTRTLTNRLEARVTGLRIIAPPFDTVIVGRTHIASAKVINLEDRPITLQSASLLLPMGAYTLNFAEKEISIEAGNTLLVPMMCRATTIGTVQGNTLRCITYNVPLDEVRREDLDTTQVEFQTYARLQTPNDIVIQVGVRALDDNVSPGSPVRLEVYLRSSKSLESIIKAGQANFQGKIRMNNQVLVLDRGETGLRLDNSRKPSLDGLQGYILPPSFWLGRSEILARIRCIAVAGTTNTTSLVLENFVWGEGSVIIDSLINGSFTAMVSRAGGTRLIAPAKTTLILTGIAPNPVKDAMDIRYSLAEGGFVTIELLDTRGNVVQSLKQEAQVSGEYTLNAKIGWLASGTYTVKISMDGEVATQQVKIVR